MIKDYKGKYDYDCIVPFSGGKDSTFTLWYLVKVKKLKPLVVRFDHNFYRKNLEANNERTIIWNDSNLSINWPLIHEIPEISDKDSYGVKICEISKEDLFL